MTADKMAAAARSLRKSRLAKTVFATDIYNKGMEELQMTSDFSVDMNEYLPFRDVVFNTLAAGNSERRTEAGERLMEIALAERLGVSRTPVREAMRKLEQEGLVVMIPEEVHRLPTSQRRI